MRTFLLCCLLCSLSAGLDARVRLPVQALVDGIEVAPTEHPFLLVFAQGTQNYQCQKGQQGDYQWVLTGPEAILLNRKGVKLGTHLFGPTWRFMDQSYVVGKVDGSVRIPNSMPLLRLRAVSHSRGGVFSSVSFIQHVNSVGGNPPMQHADEKHLGQIVKVPYTAIYVFYRPKHR